MIPLPQYFVLANHKALTASCMSWGSHPDVFGWCHAARHVHAALARVAPNVTYKARNEPKVIATKTKTTKQEQNITGRRGSRENHQLSQP